MRAFGRWCLALALAGAAVGCGDTVERESLAARGATLARSTAVSRSRYNFYACATCHALGPSEAGDRVLAGAPLAGAARRAGYWNGETLSLREAVERCWVTFMRGIPTDLDGPTGSALDAWLQSIAPGDAEVTTAQLVFTWPRSVQDIPMEGDVSRGQRAYGRACANCHGAVHTGVGRLNALVSVVPEDTITEHAMDTRPVGVRPESYLRAIVVEKVRHGSFLGYAGVMPPFSTELLSDADLADVLAYMGLHRPAAM